MLDSKVDQQAAVVDKYVDPAAAYQMTTQDYVVRPDTSSAAVTVTLPSVAEAAGRIYTVACRSASNAITLQDQDDSEAWTDLTLDAVGDKVALYSDGLAWHVINEIA